MTLSKFSSPSPRLWCGLVLLLLNTALLTGVAAAQNAVGFTTAPPSGQFSIQGCRNDGTITLPSTNNAEGGGFVCPDAAYTTGNLGKGWNELDLVPFRLVTSTNKGAITDYNIVIAGEYSDNGHLGWDVIGSDAGGAAAGNNSFYSPGPTINPNSDASCSAEWNGFFVNGPGLSGSNASIYRTLLVHQAAGSTCIFDYYMRLALGSHLYPGASLHGFKLQSADFSQGEADVPLPVNQISPQQLSKSMTATQGADHAWTIDKSITGVSGLPNTCSTAATALQGKVTVKIDWAKQAAAPGGAITVNVTITLTNPASRTIEATVEDKIYEGADATGTLVDDHTFAPVVVPAASNGIAGTYVINYQFVDSNSNATEFFDQAIATYTDLVTGIPIPGNTKATATAQVQQGGTVTNQTATIQDVETLTDPLNLLQFEVTSVTNSFGSGGSFTSPCTLNFLTNSCTWTSGTLGSAADATDSGTITFAKTVQASSAGNVTTGTLSDTATLTGSDGFTAQASASTQISAATSVSLTINKTLTSTATGSFTFHIYNSLGRGAGGNTLGTELAACLQSSPADAPCSPKVISITSGTSGSAVLNGLSPDDYLVTEDTQTGWKQNTSNPQESNLSTDPNTGATTCTGSVTFSNTQQGTIIVQKVTVPSGGSGFVFTGDAAGTIGDGGSITVNNLNPGSYTSTEADPTQLTPPYDLTKISCTTDGSGNLGTLTATFNLHAGETITCTFTNTERGTLLIKKVTEGADGTFKFNDSGTGMPTSPISITTTGTTTTVNGGGSYPVITLVPGNGYSVSEQTPNSGGVGFAQIGTGSCDNGTPANILIVAGQETTCTFTNATAFVKVIKTLNGSSNLGANSFTFQLRYGASASAAGTTLEMLTATGVNNTLNFTTHLIPGTQYEMCEQMQAGWLTSLGPPTYSVFNPSGDNSVVCTNFTPTAGQTSTTTFNINNQPPPGGMALTIGYWKNWSSCTGGGQKPTLDQMLYKATPPGIYVGLVDLLGGATPNISPYCAEAVNILSKRTITGKNQASNPFYNLAAQLLAAELNQVAGAGVSACAATDINSAQNLLTAVGFNDSSIPKGTTSQQNIANALQTQLNNYNNNLPVSCITYP